jgi:mRNA interferase MazF
VLLCIEWIQAQPKRGHEQRGHRYGLITNPSAMSWNAVTIIPTSTSAQSAIFRPELELGGVITKFLVDQIRSIDISYVHGDPTHFLDYNEMAIIEQAVTRYLGFD